MHRIYVSILMLCICCSTTLAQTFRSFVYKMQNEPEYISETLSDFYEFLDENFPNGIPQDRLSEYKDVMRYFNIWKSRLGIKDGVLSQYPYIEYSQKNAITPIRPDMDAAAWELISPKRFPTQILGLVSEVLSDYSADGNHILSSENGGLWRFNNTSGGWDNVTDNINMPGIAATEIIRNPFHPNHLIASTGNGFSLKFIQQTLKNVYFSL